MKIDPDSMAFPVVTEGGFSSGLTIRAEFAKAAMMGLLGNSDVDLRCAQLASVAVKAADELIARLNQDES